MYPTLLSTLGLSLLSPIEDNKDYLQNHIIFKINQTIDCINFFRTEIEDNVCYSCVILYVFHKILIKEDNT